jgi:hypothetical protein
MYSPLKSWAKNPKKLSRDGYVLVQVLSHPKSFNGGWYYEHRLVYEKKLGRILERWEEVHHINEIKDHNYADNLILCTRSEHMRAHRCPT